MRVIVSSGLENRAGGSTKETDDATFLPVTRFMICIDLIVWLKLTVWRCELKVTKFHAYKSGEPVRFLLRTFLFFFSRIMKITVPWLPEFA